MNSSSCCDKSQKCCEKNKDAGSSNNMEEIGGNSCCNGTANKNFQVNNPKSCCSVGKQTCDEKNLASSCCIDEGKTNCCNGNAMDLTHSEAAGKVEPVNSSTCCSDSTQNCCSATTKIVPIPTTSCCTDKSTQPHVTCLAVIRPSQTTIVVFDASGCPKSFSSDTNIQPNASKRLCFSSHNIGPNVDGMLTHCFDSAGLHGTPEEECACGIEEAHLHAHWHNPEICQDVCNSNTESEAVKRKLKLNWRFLSQITLYAEEDSLHNMPINPSLPKECNSLVVQEHLHSQGLQLASRECCTNSNDTTKSSSPCKIHRKYKIHHEDHLDYLVHNEETGGLHMEHPCGDCGENDIHGKFSLTHTRSWLDDSATNLAKEKEAKKEFRLHFFQEPHVEPFSLFDVFSHLFELESSRVHAVRVVDDLLELDASTVRPLSASSTISMGESLRKVGRSQFFVEKICCASETRQIQSLLGKVKGVAEVMVNTTTKVAYVDHDPNVISAEEIADILNEQKFGAHVKKDCAVDIAKLSGIPMDVVVVSRFHIVYELRMTETNDRTKTLDVVESCLRERFPKEGELCSVLVDTSSDVLIVEHNPYFLTAGAIADALDSYGYEVKIDCDGGADGLWALATMQADVDDTIEHHKSTVKPTVILSGIFLIVSLLSFIGGKWDYLKYVALLSVAAGLPPIAIKACTTLRRFHFDVNCMMLFAVIGAVALQEFTEAAAVTFLFAISEALESKCTSRARNALAAIICLRPEHANLINPITQDVVVLPAAAVAVGSLVRVRPGDKVPCDGVIMEGSSAIDESNLTGESRPVSKSTGMVVSGGTINAGSGQIVVKTTATSDDSAVSRLIRLVEEAQINRSDTEKMVDKFAKIYTPFVVLVALCMATIPWAFGREVGQFWLHNALVTIVIACPCALVISTPVVYVAGLTASAQRGVIVKGGQHLESLGRVKAISFDKTGTLSQGIFQLLEFREIGGRSREEVLSLLALMEAPASHPLSNAIVKGAANENVSIPSDLEAKDHTLLAGEGITAVVENKRVYVGNKKLFQRIGLYNDLPSDISAMVDEWSRAGGTTGFISIEGDGIVGAYCVADRIRDEAKSAVSALKKMGIDITMLTGDLHPAAISIGDQIGLKEEHIKSELLPEDKLNEISSKVAAEKEKAGCCKSKRSVMMVGDGVNDAPALALSDVSVAMGEGSSLALETSDITLMDSNLSKLLYVVRMGRRVIRTINENIFISLFLKALVVGLLFAGWGSLWAAIASDVGAMLIVTLNGMKLLPYSQKVDMSQSAASNAKGVQEV